MKICILGGGGCFALNFARFLEKQGIEHFGIGRSRKEKAFWQVEHEYRFFTLHLVDDFGSVVSVLDQERPDIIVNYAAQGEGAASFGENASDFFRTNTWGLSRVAWEIHKLGFVRRFVQIGTSEAYGSVDHPAKESEDGKGTSPYCISKQAFDDYLKTLFRIHGFPMNIVRPCNSYTPGQQLYRVIPKAIVSALTRKKLPLQGGGKAFKSYIHSTDLSKAVLSVIEKAPLGKIYNVGPVSPISIRSLVSEVAEASGVSFDELVEEVQDRVGQDGKYWLDSTEIAKDCGWTQSIGLRNGLDEMVSWVRSYPSLLTADTSYRHRP